MSRSRLQAAAGTVEYWRMLELFSPQPVPKRRDPGVTEWSDRSSGLVLPWEKTAPEAGRDKVWNHAVYLGLYPVSSAYEWLHAAFADARDAFDTRPPGESACAALLVDHEGRVVEGSGTLSSALWAIGRIRSGEHTAPGWVDGFARASSDFDEAVADLMAATEGAGQRPIDHDALGQLIASAHIAAGIGSDERIGSRDVRIKSIRVDAVRPETSSSTDFLNSFHLDDLAAVQRSIHARGAGAALRAYLTAESDLDVRGRIDVAADTQSEDEQLSPAKLPHGRWPSPAQHHLARSQQFAVNHVFDSLGDAGGVRGVNGPPGTGKTTMLRDVLAGNVVERARRLATLRSADDAFTSTTHGWSEGQYRRSVPVLRDFLTGFEMVVASANNAAVENISVELPAVGAIDPTHADADYFADIASSLLDARGDPRSTRSAWGLVAAKLGNKDNRTTFRSLFWFGRKSTTTTGMQDRLKKWAAGTDVPAWSEARDRFRAAERRVTRLLDERGAAHRRIAQLAIRSGELPPLREELERVDRLAESTRRAVDAHQSALETATANAAEAERRRQLHIDTRPNWIEALLSLGKAPRDWRTRLEPLEHRCTEMRRHVDESTARHTEARRTAQRAAETLSDAELRLASAQSDVDSLIRRCATDRSQFGDAYPVTDAALPAFHLRAPWLDEDLDDARSELFLEALDLHAVWVANTAATSQKGLRAAMSVVAGDAPRGLDHKAVAAAWQLLFMVVPMVSTTFASVGRMFDGLGPESLGWLLIDEAGQACPQHAAGAIWRARRVLAVGDPLQLQPVVTMPHKAQRDIAAAYGVSSTWIAPAASVQTLADRVSPYGTTLPFGDESVWVGSPLRVHRRCDEPMFSFSNEVAYDGLMVSGVRRTLDDSARPDLFDSPDGPRIVRSYWADTPAETRGSHLQERELDRLELGLQYLDAHGVDRSEIIAVSPFRDVARRLDAIAKEHPRMRSGGTIHTAQGREADVVFLVLGGDPGSPGAKSWASETVNLVNVAVSRAKRRLYVIGDRSAWSRYPYFGELATALG